MTNIEKIIIGILSVVFVVVLGAATWDLYGRNLFTTKISSRVESNINIATQSGKPANTQGKNKGIKQPGKQNSANQSKPTGQTNYSTYSQCIENTKDLGSSKDCCDCLAADGSVRKACRDFAATYDYSKNTVIKTFEIPSKLGRSGDYSACTASGDQDSCKQCCESSATGLACGDYQYCRTACNNLAQ